MQVVKFGNGVGLRIAVFPNIRRANEMNAIMKVTGQMKLVGCKNVNSLDPRLP